ncbi:MAG: phosphotransferase family protein [Elioraea sp.]|nr:phosphotransferase family protein [Elioraea sp.]MDW8443493.1 phosphotransferase family protein [Acetobacteraceae bacterium]
MHEGCRERLRTWLARAAGEESLAILSAERLSGGAIQQNWGLVVRRDDGAEERWVLRTDNPATLEVSHGRTQEFALLRAAHAAGVSVPEPLFACDDAGVIGAPFLVMRRVEGIASAHRVVKWDDVGGGRERAARAMGRELARIHRIRPPREDLAFLGEPPGDPCHAFCEAQERALDAAAPHPILEWGLRHLRRTAPPPVPAVLCHNDFRTGNILWTERGLAAVLDWEFAAWGDPHADLGWLCARCWRFGNLAMEAGGVGPRTGLYAGYVEGGGDPPDPTRVAWWELAAHLRWATIALAQGERHLSGREPSLELALTPHIVPELEWHIVRDVAARERTGEAVA